MVKKVKISSIKPNQDNPRIIKDDKFQKLVTSLKDFPEMATVRPIVVNKDMVVLGGNMRLKAMQEAGWKDVPVEIVNWPEDKQKEFIIKDNVGFGEWDWELIANEWDAVKLGEWGLDIPDFVNKGEAVEDDYEIPDEIETDIVLGDLFEIGEHRLLCGDSTDSDAVARLMDGQKAELLFTSPPYSDMREYEGGKDLSIKNLIEFIPTFLPYAKYQVINLGIQRKDNDIVQYWDDYISKAKECGYKFLSWNVWDKGMAGSIGNQSAFIPISHEWIFVFGESFKDINRTKERSVEPKKEKTRTRRQKDGSMKTSSVGIETRLTEMKSVFSQTPELGEIRTLHPATFPILLPSEYINAMTNSGDYVCEPFTGSGTTMVASHQLNRKCYGMELDPKYCQVIVDRMRKLDPALVIKKNGVPLE